MALKLGELLINEGLITQQQLEEALKCQVFFGIKLGSSLIELGFIEEASLVRLLSKKLGVPAVSRKELQGVPHSIYSLLPSALAEKYRVIPVKLDSKRLSVAMSDPTDFKAIDELSFVTGYIIQPFIAPDILISSALEKYYQVTRDLRYMRVSGGLRRSTATAETKTEAVPPKPDSKVHEAIPVTYQKEDGELLSLTIPAEFKGFASMEGYDQNDMQVPSDELVRYTVDRLSIDFANASSRDAVANVFITYLGQEFTSGALFIVRGNGAVGWRGIRAGEKISDFTNLNLLLSKPSVIKDVVETMNFSMGALLNTPENNQILNVLSIRPETPLLVLPVIMLKKVVAVVLVSADMESLGRRLGELQKLVRKASLAFDMLIIKNKILMT